MSFENKCFSELLKITQAGLGFTLKATTLSPDELRQMSEAAAESGAQLTIMENAIIEPEYFSQNET